MSKLAVIGSRNITDENIIHLLIDDILQKYCITMFVSGGANGVDSIAEAYMKSLNIPCKIHKPDWNKYGKSAGFVRNRLIIDDVDIVLAIWDGVSQGTLNSINIALQTKTVKALHIHKVT